MSALDELVGDSPVMQALRRDVVKILTIAQEARRLPSILIQGETGTGKGLLARLVHRHGPRARGPFVDVDCARIPETLLESELFGFERGVFTDAHRSKRGLFQTSHGGVLFMDEIGLMPEILQGKLLTAIEDRAVRRLGGTVKEPFDAWIICATNANLQRDVREHRFREDLYHRLAVLTLRLPPLRERDGDVVLLAERFLAQWAREYGMRPKALTAEARTYLARYSWPGNVRELANTMERLALLVDAEAITAADLDTSLGDDHASVEHASVPSPGPPAEGDDERNRLITALEATQWNIMRTASALG